MPRSKHLKDADRFSRLIQARHPCVHICTFEEEYALELIRSAALDLRLTLRMWTAVEGVRDGLIEDKQPIPGTQAPAAAMFHLTNHLDRCMTVMVDLGDHLQESTALRALRQLIQHYRKTGSILVLLDHRQTLPPVVASHAFPFDLSLPDETELSELVRQTLRREHAVSPIKVNLRKEQFRAIVKNLRGLTRRQAVQIIRECLVDRSFDGQDVNHVVAAKRSVLCSGGLLEYVESPVTLDGVGGLARLKSWLLKRRHALSEEATRAGLTPPRGLLILGVQGAGKSLCAKAIAAAWQWPLLRLDPGVLYDRYIGESERRLRDALQQAAMMAPIVLWIDEIEKAFASAASHSIDGGLSQRMFGSLLTWMQERQEPVFVIATANNIEALPPELLRKGRFDEIFFVDLPNRDVRKAIFSIHLKKRGHNPEAFDLNALADASEGYSGAEIEQAVIAALHESFASKQKLATRHIQAALAASPPLSVTMAEHIEMLRAWASGRCAPAD